MPLFDRRRTVIDHGQQIVRMELGVVLPVKADPSPSLKVECLPPSSRMMRPVFCLISYTSQVLRIEINKLPLYASLRRPMCRRLAKRAAEPFGETSIANPDALAVYGARPPAPLRRRFPWHSAPS